MRPFSIGNALAWLSVLAAYVVFFGWNEPIHYLSVDSAQYLAVADKIVNWKVPILDADMSYADYLRSPGLPLLLAAAKLLSPENLRIGLIFCHSLLGAATILLFAKALSSYLPGVIGAWIALLTLYFARPANVTVITEWSTINYLLIFASSGLLFLKHGSLRWFSLNLCICTVTTLTRPEFVFLYLISLLIIALVSASSKVGTVEPPRLLLAAGIFVLALFPVLAWASFNYLRMNNFTISPAGTVSLFGVASSLTATPERPGDSGELKAFLDFVGHNSRRLIEAEAGSTARNMFDAVAGNGTLIAAFRSESASSWSKVHELAGIYISRALYQNLKLWLSYVVSGVSQVYFTTLILCVSAVIVPLLYFRSANLWPFVVSSLILYAIHVAHVLLICTVGIMHNRYYLITFIPLTGFSFASLVLYLHCLFGFSLKGEMGSEKEAL